MEIYLKEKLKHLIALRNIISTTLVVLIGGLFGLHLIIPNKIAYIIALTAGLYYVTILMMNFSETHRNIVKTLEDLRHV